MPIVRSGDGAAIRWQETGSGPTVVFVVGALCDRQRTVGITDLLKDRFRVIEYDRRGRGDSEPTPPRSVAQEVADLAAVIADVSPERPPSVWGHSSGGILALLALSSSIPVAKAVIHEPFIPGSSAVLAEIVDALARNDRDAAVTTFLATTGMPAAAIAGMRDTGYWSRALDLAPTLPADLRLSAEPVPGIAGAKVPVLASWGGASPDWARQVANSVVDHIEGATTMEIPGAGHGLDDAVAADFIARHLG